MREAKGVRKSKSLYNRRACFLFIKSIFQKAHLKAQGTTEERFHTALKAVDDEFRSLANSEPNKNSFYMLVQNDFKKFLLDATEKHQLIEEAKNLVSNKNEVKA